MQYGFQWEWKWHTSGRHAAGRHAPGRYTPGRHTAGWHTPGRHTSTDYTNAGHASSVDTTRLNAGVERSELGLFPLVGKQTECDVNRCLQWPRSHSVSIQGSSRVKTSGGIWERGFLAWAASRG